MENNVQVVPFCGLLQCIEVTTKDTVLRFLFHVLLFCCGFKSVQKIDKLFDSKSTFIKNKMNSNLNLHHNISDPEICRQL